MIHVGTTVALGEEVTINYPCKFVAKNINGKIMVEIKIDDPNATTGIKIDQNGKSIG